MSDFKYLEMLNRGRAKVSASDFESFSRFPWRQNHHGYAAFRKGTALKDEKTYLMHREILSAKPGQIVDHINGDRLDNRRENLRLTDRSKNMMNRQVGARGVHKSGSTWVARIGFKMERIYIGRFKTKAEAKTAYTAKAKELFGKHFS